MKEALGEKYQQVKDHVRENKTVYVACGVTAVVSVAGTLLAVKSSTVVNARAIQLLTYKSVQTIDVHVEALGDPGNIVQDLTTGIIYASQGQAARALGVAPSRISDHLNGRTPHVMGTQLKVLGKAAVSE